MALFRSIRRSLFAAWGCVAFGLLMMFAGIVALPLAGRGAAYASAVGLWLLVTSVLPAVVLLIAVAVLRVKSGRWYFGITEVNER